MSDSTPTPTPDDRLARTAVAKEPTWEEWLRAQVAIVAAEAPAPQEPDDA